MSFYYWKTVFKLSETEKQVLSENGVTQLYLRYFDIELSPKTLKPQPVSAIHFNEKPQQKVVPVVYLKNEVMLQKDLDVKDLVAKTRDFIQQINRKNDIHVDEIQIDCDWTLASRDQYLKFIDLFQKSATEKLSATIRLHQVKYFGQTKIPNVDYGVLMYYNMGKIAPDSLNSIYNRQIAERYLKSLQNYPLRLEVALPVYSWAVHIRDNKAIGLKNKMSLSELNEDKNFKKTGSYFFEVRVSHYKNGTFYRKNDRLKIECIQPKDLEEMASDLSYNLKTIPKQVIFYDLDEYNTNNYEKGFFKQITDRF